jgi:hypothetical protein
MSFTTGTAQRRGLRSATQGISFAHLKQTSFPQIDQIRQLGKNRSTKKRRKTASIGDDSATGLAIHGTHDFDPMEGDDPDGATPPVSGNTLANPDFPISYTGRGTMKFVSPIRITTVDGPLNVNGEVYSSSGLLGPTVIDHTPWAIAVGEPGVGDNLVEDATETYATYSLTSDNVTITAHFTWNSKGSVANGDNIYVKGIPHILATQIHRVPIHAEGIIATQIGSVFSLHGAIDSDEYQLVSTDSATGLEVPVTGAELNTSGRISFSFSYHGNIP